MKLAYLFLLFCVPGVYAFDCSSFTNATLQSNCALLNPVNPDLVASLIVLPGDSPNHSAIGAYNDALPGDVAPDTTVSVSNASISGAWVAIHALQPSVLYEGVLWVPNASVARSGYGYNITVPPRESYNRRVSGQLCRVDHELVETGDSLRVNVNGVLAGTANQTGIAVSGAAALQSELSIFATMKNTEYTWRRVCSRQSGGNCVQWRYVCSQSKVTSNTDTVTVQANRSVVEATAAPASFVLQSQPSGSWRGTILSPNTSVSAVQAGNSTIRESHLWYASTFTSEPNDFLQLTAKYQPNAQIINGLRSNGTYYVRSAQPCTIETTDLFTTVAKNCTYNGTAPSAPPFISAPTPPSWNRIMLLAGVALALFLLFLLLFRRMKRMPFFLLVTLLSTPAVYAAPCDITDLGSCIPQAIFGFFIDLLNSPLQPLLDMIRSLLENPVDVTLFHGAWQIITYAISFFYGILLLYTGFQFLFAGNDVVKRETAKEWMRNIVVMILLIQLSYYLYEIVISISASASGAILSFADPNFFLLTADNITNVGLQFLFVLTYAGVLLITLVLLTLRYAIVALGILFLPIGLFCYFLPPLRSYGAMLLHMLGMCIFVTSLAAIVILGGATLLADPNFANMKILIMIVCFFIVDLLFVLLAKLIIAKAGAGGSITQAVKYIGGVL